MLGVLYDIHGNLPALERVLEEAGQLDIDRWLLGGDYGTPSPWPDETLARLKELPNATWIRGNGERWLREPPLDRPEVMATYDLFRGSLSEDVVAWLYALPTQAELDGILYVHGSPLSDVESFAPEREESEERLLDGVRDRTVVFGHSHQQFRRAGPDGTYLVNPGSAGMPLDGDTRGAWATGTATSSFAAPSTTQPVRRPATARWAATSAKWSPGGSSAAPTRARCASRVTSTLPLSACETGQFSLAPCAACWNASSSIPSTSPRMLSAIFVILKPSPTFSKVVRASDSSLVGGMCRPARARAPAP